jgi:hypothetical protein
VTSPAPEHRLTAGLVAFKEGTAHQMIPCKASLQHYLYMHQASTTFMLVLLQPVISGPRFAFFFFLGVSSTRDPHAYRNLSGSAQTPICMRIFRGEKVKSPTGPGSTHDLQLLYPSPFDRPLTWVSDTKLTFCQARPCGGMLRLGTKRPQHDRQALHAPIFASSLAAE